MVISIYYYFGVVRAIYWSKEPADLTPIPCHSAEGFVGRVYRRNDLFGRVSSHADEMGWIRRG
jgi:hypothetical protein